MIRIDLTDIFEKQIKLLNSFDPNYENLLGQTNSFSLFIIEELYEYIDEFKKNISIKDFNRKIYTNSDDIIFELVDILMFLSSYLIESYSYQKFLKSLPVNYKSINTFKYFINKKIYDIEGLNTIYSISEKNINYGNIDENILIDVIDNKIIVIDNDNHDKIINYFSSNIVINLIDILIKIRKLLPERKYHRHIKNEFSELEIVNRIIVYINEMILIILKYILSLNMYSIDINYNEFFNIFLNYVNEKENTFL